MRYICQFLRYLFIIESNYTQQVLGNGTRKWYLNVKFTCGGQLSFLFSSLFSMNVEAVNLFLVIVKIKSTLT